MRGGSLSSISAMMPDSLGGSGRRRGAGLSLQPPQTRPRRVQMGQIDPQLKLQLVVAWLHVAAQLVKGLVMGALLEVRQLMHADHGEELGRCVLEQGSDADFAFGFEFVALHARYRGVGAQRVLHDLQFAVTRYLG